MTPFPVPGRKWQISQDGGFLPGWSKEGSRRISYVNKSTMLIAVTVRAEGSSFEILSHEPLFNLRGATGGCIARDGETGILVMPTVENQDQWITLVLNWTRTLDQRRQ